MIVALGLGVGSAAPAASAEEPAPAITFMLDTTTTVTYGESWQIQSYVNRQPFAYTSFETVATASGLTAEQLIIGQGDFSVTGWVNVLYSGTVINAGTYEIKETWRGTRAGAGEETATTPTTARLVVEPASVASELYLTPDLAAPGNLVIHVGFTGAFVDSWYFSPGYGAAAPAGTWTVTITDEDGATAHSATIERDALSSTMTDTAYWTGAQATFTAAGDTTTNYVITQPEPFAVTGATSTRPVPESTAVVPDAAAEPVRPDFSVPVWWVILIGVVIVALVVFVIIFAIRLGRSGIPERKSISHED